jgi:hypothetical protein
MVQSSTESVPAPLDSESSVARRLGDILIWLLLFLMTFSLPKNATVDLDNSWRMGLTYFLDHGYAFGRDVIFTYGPLGFLLGRTYTGEYLWALLGWQVVQAVVTATLLVRLSHGLCGTARFFCLTFFVLFGVGYEDALQTMLIVLIGWSLVHRLSETASRVRVVAPSAFLAFLGAIKFTNLMLACLVVFVLAAFALRRRRATESWLMVAVFSGSFIAIWLGCGQPLSALPAYAWNSLEISSGYQATMGLPTPVAPFWKALVVLGLIGGYMVWMLRTQVDRLRSTALLLILAGFLYLNWKHGFVRADGHMLGFFYSPLVVCLTFPALFKEVGQSRWIARLLLVPAALLCLWGINDALPPVVKYAAGIAQEKVVQNLDAVVHWPSVRADLQQKLEAQRAAADLPLTRAVIGKATVDVLGFEQGVALLNQFKYRARPVFQSYSAYTPRLNELNVDFYNSRRAPEYVLFKLQVIDERPLLLDDSDLLRIFPHYYRYVHSEKGYDLWRRRDSVPPFEQLLPRPLTRKTLPVGESLRLGEFEHKPLWVQIDLQSSLLGRVRSFLYKPPIVHLHISDTEGKDTVYRLPLPAARAGFALNPLVTDRESYVESQGGNPSQWVRSIQLEVDSSDSKYFVNTADFTLSAITPSNAKADYAREALREKYSMFSLIPEDIHAFTEPAKVLIDGHTSMVMHAPSSMTFTLPPGVHHVKGSFGYVPGAYENGGHTDGGEFRVIWSDDTERRVLFKQLLRPAQEPADRGLKHFDADLRNLPPGHLYLEVSPGPNGDHSWDWTAWADVKIE